MGFDYKAWARQQLQGGGQPQPPQQPAQFDYDSWARQQIGLPARPSSSPGAAAQWAFPETPYGAVNPKSPLYRAAAWLEDRVKPGIMQVINTMGVPLGMGEELTKGFHPAVRLAFPGLSRYKLAAYQAITHPGALGQAWNTIRERGARNEPPPSPMEYWGQKMPEHPWLAAGIGFAESAAMDPFMYVHKGPLAIARLGQGRAVTRSAAIAQGIVAEAGAQFGEGVGSRIAQASRTLAEEATKFAYPATRRGFHPVRIEQMSGYSLSRTSPAFKQAAVAMAQELKAAGVPRGQILGFRDNAMRAAMSVAAKSAAEDMRPMWGFGVSAEKSIPLLPATGGGEAMWRGARGAIEARRPMLAPALDRAQDAYSKAYRAFNMGSRGTPVERMQGERIRQFQAAETQRQATSAETMTGMQSARTGQEAAHFIGAAKAYQYGKVADFQEEVMAAGALYDPNAAPMFAQRYGFTQRDLQALEPMASGIAAEVRAGHTIEQTRLGSPSVRQAVASVEDAARNAPTEAEGFKIIRDAVWKGTQDQVAYRKLQLAAIAQTDDILGGLGGPWGPLNRASKARAVMEQAGLDARGFKRALLREDDLGLVEAGRYDEILDDLTNNITVTKWDRASRSFKPVPVMAAMAQSVEDYREWMVKLGDDATMRGMLESMTDEEVNAYMHGAAPSEAAVPNMERAIKQQIGLAIRRGAKGTEDLLKRTDNLYQFIKTIPRTLEKRFRDSRAAQIASAEAVVKLGGKAEDAAIRAAHKARVQAGLETVRDAAALQRQEQLGALGQQYAGLAQRQVINLEQQAGRAAVKQVSRKQMLAEQAALREEMPRRMAEAEGAIREARPAPTAAERDAIAYMWTQLDSVDQEFLADDLKTWLSTQGVDMPKGWVIPETDTFLGMQGPRPGWSKEQTFSHPIRAAWSGLRRNLDFFSAMWMRDKAQNRAIMRQDMGSYLQGIGIPEEMARQSAEFQHYVPLEVAARTAGVTDPSAVYRVWPEFRGMRFHPDVANGIVRHMVAPWTKYPFLTALGDQYLKYLRSWKAGATVASPVWAMVNLMGNVYNSALRGLTNPVRYLEGAAISTGNEKAANAYAAAASRIPGSIIKRAGDRWVIETWQGTMDLAQAHQFAIEHGVFSGWTSSELSRMSPSKVNQFMDISNRVGNPFSPDFYGYWGTKRFGRWTEDVSRNALFWDQIAKGHMAEESSQIVAATLFDYSSLTREEKAVRNFGAPFYTWMKNNLKYQLQMLMEHPGWAAAVPRAMENSRYLIPEEQRVPGGLIPQYLSDTLSVQAGHDEQGRPIFWTVRLPVFDLVRLSTIQEILSAAGPMKLLPEVMANYSVFYGRPIDYARPEGTTWVKAPWWVPLKTNWGNRVIKNPKTGELMIDKTTLYQLENAFPALAKATQAGVYSTPNGQEVSTVKVWGWSIPTKTLRYTGIRPTPVDLRQQVKRLRRERTMEIQRARSRYRQTSSLPPQAE